MNMRTTRSGFGVRSESTRRDKHSYITIFLQQSYELAYFLNTGGAFPMFDLDFDSRRYSAQRVTICNYVHPPILALGRYKRGVVTHST